MSREPDEIRLRAARAAECRELSRLAVRAKAHWGYDDAALRLWADELTITPVTVATHTVVVAARHGDERPVGFYALERDGNRAELAHLWVEPAAIGRGVGRRLLEHAIVTAGRAGIRSIGIDADPHAEGFYLRLGARRTGESAAPLPQHDDRVLPRLVLATGAPARPDGPTRPGDD